MQAVREAAGWDMSLCTDHFGHGYLTAKEVIRLAEALEPYNLAWLEDPMPWWDVEGHKQVTDAIRIPTAAGEELYLWDGFRELIEQRAVDIVHPDLLTSGGMAGDQAHRRLRRALWAVHGHALRRLARSPSWPPCTARRRLPALWRWSTTGWICRSGPAW